MEEMDDSESGNIQIGAQATAARAARHAQVEIVRCDDREPAERQIAVIVSAEHVSFTEDVPKADLFDQVVNLIAYDLLKRNNIGLNLAEHVDDTIGTHLPIHASRFVRVVGDDAKAWAAHPNFIFA